MAITMDDPARCFVIRQAPQIRVRMRMNWSAHYRVSSQIRPGSRVLIPT